MHLIYLNKEEIFFDKKATSENAMQEKRMSPFFVFVIL